MAIDDGDNRPADGPEGRPPDADESPPAARPDGGERNRPAGAQRRPARGGEPRPTPDDELSPAELADAERAVDEALGEPPAPVRLHEQLVAERDEYRDALLRIKADFENYKKRVAKDHAATVERAAERLVTDLLPVLDACEAAIGQGAADVEPIHKSLLDVLEKSGLTRMSPDGQPFDPNLHEAVMHEPGDDDSSGTVVTGSLRTGYLWNGRVVRPAMVKVRG